MKVKHFQGYGTVNVTYKTELDKLTIVVDGSMHEQGAVRPDAYDIYHWLVERKWPGLDYYQLDYKLIGNYEKCIYIVTSNGSGKVDTEECKLW